MGYVSPNSVPSIDGGVTPAFSWIKDFRQIASRGLRLSVLPRSMAKSHTTWRIAMATAPIFRTGT